MSNQQQQGSSNGGLTLQINSVAALERLIGGDTEMEIALRRSIVAEFVANHLDAIAKSAVADEMRGYEAKVKELVKDHVLKTTKTGAWTTSTTLTSDMVEKIREEVGRQVSSEVNKFATAEIEKLRRQIGPHIEREINKDFERRVNDAVKQRLEQLRQLLPVSEQETRKVTVPT